MEVIFLDTIGKLLEWNHIHDESKLRRRPIYDTCFAYAQPTYLIFDAATTAMAEYVLNSRYFELF